MEPPPSHSPTIAIIGAGLSGLAAAHELLQRDPRPRIRIFEASDRAGGVIDSVGRDGFLIERSADSFLTTEEMPWARELVIELGLEDQLIPTNTQHRGAQVFLAGQTYPIPAGFQLMAPGRWRSLMQSELLSWRGRCRVAMERWIPARRNGPEESLERFATRRLGSEAYERLVQPLVAGIYAADPTRLSVEAALPRFIRWERTYGSLTRGARKESTSQSAAGARYGSFATMRLGMGQLIGALVDRLPDASLRLGERVDSLRRCREHLWELITHLGKTERYDAVVVATPPHVSAELLKREDARLAALLSGIESASVAVVSMGFRTDQITHPLNTFGVVVPLSSGLPVLAVSLSSVKFPHRAPSGCVLLRCFLGGACYPECLELGDAALQQAALTHVDEILGVSGEPMLVQVDRWMRATPGYHLGHRDRVRDIGERVRMLPRVALAGNAFDGVGIPQCINSGRRAAEQVRLELEQRC